MDDRMHRRMMAWLFGGMAAFAAFVCYCLWVGASPATVPMPSPSPPVAPTPAPRATETEAERYGREMMESDARALASVRGRFTEDQRRTMIQQIDAEEEKAEREATRRVPVPDEVGDRAERALDRRARLQNELEERGHDRVRQRHGLSKDELAALIREEGYRQFGQPIPE